MSKEVLFDLYRMEKEGRLKSCLIEFELPKDGKGKARFVRVFYASEVEEKAKNAIYDRTTEEKESIS